MLPYGANFRHWTRRRYFLSEYIDELIDQGWNPNVAGMIAGMAFSRVKL